MFHPAQLLRRISLKSWGKPKELKKPEEQLELQPAAVEISSMDVFAVNLVKTTCQLKVFHYKKFFPSGMGEVQSLLFFCT